MPPSWPPVPACAPRLCCRRAIPHYSGDGAASIPKSGPEIKNRCTKEGVNGEKLTSIRKSGLEIKNHFSSKSVLQAEPFFSAATKIRIGRGRSSPPRLLHADPFFSAATKTGYVSNFKELLFYGVCPRCNLYNFTELNMLNLPRNCCLI